MKSNILSLILILGGVTALFAQNNSGNINSYGGQNNVEYLGGGGTQSTVMVRNSYKGILGSPYISDNWQEGSIKTQQTEIRGLKLKYDAYGDKLLYIHPETNDSLYADKNLVLAFTLGNQKFTKVDYQDEQGRTLAGFFEIIHQEKSMLLRQYVKILEKASYQGAYSANNPYDKLLDADYLFIKTPHSNEAQRFRKTTKSLLSFFPPEKTEAIESYIKTQKINPKDEKDIIKTLQYADQL